MAKDYRFQTYGMAADGAVVHCGPRDCKRYGQATAQRDHDEWEAQTVALTLEVPDCPRSQDWLTGRRVVAIIAHPIGNPNKQRCFPVHSRPR